MNFKRQFNRAGPSAAFMLYHICLSASETRLESYPLRRLQPPSSKTMFSCLGTGTEAEAEGQAEGGHAAGGGARGGAPAPVSVAGSEDGVVTKSDSSSGESG